LLALVEDPKARDELAAMPDLADVLADHLADGRATWPQVALADDDYVRHLAGAVRDRSGESAERVVRTMPAADLYLAAACSAGDARAIEVFRDALWPQVHDVLARLGATAAQLDETEQRVLEMLFVAAPDARPQIAGYSGRGRLRSWLRSIGVRTGRRLMGTSAAGGNDDLDRMPAAVDDPQLVLLRTQYSGTFRAALVAAFGALTDRQRNLLRQYHLDELTIDQLGALYHVNRATAARWVIGARAALLDETRSRLAAELAISTGEVDSIIRLVRSRIDVSIRDLLGDDG
jgi:RNA polymerase sigma-70 factor (ECF subfamily)